MKLFNNIFHNKELLKGLLKHADLLNTVNGGVVPTTVQIVNTEESIIIKVSAPTVEGDSFSVLLNYSKLTISIFAKQADKRGSLIFVPMFIQTYDIPPLVDFDMIEAIYKNGELEVILPLKYSRVSLQRIIDVKQF